MDSIKSMGKSAPVGDLLEPLTRMQWCCQKTGECCCPQVVADEETLISAAVLAGNSSSALFAIIVASCGAHSLCRARLVSGEALMVSMMQESRLGSHAAN